MHTRRRTTVAAACLGLALSLSLTACGGGGQKAVKGMLVQTTNTPSTLYCVQLDNVNGKSSQDGRWYEVKQKDYNKASSSEPGARLKFTPKDDDCKRSSNGSSSSYSDDDHKSYKKHKSYKSGTSKSRSRSGGGSGSGGRVSKSRR
ncbi:hypothetical protein [Streptomyces sp. SID11385]|uniref:hypothetical protein n=1 Tax=Streptomyces sp. SID11385 TaxID=2706031 RepID=UPI0013C9BD65|nr:hypothetical protein [Streptomyces sp. SID11385]NEA39779.1 hypothetical protein [Streptomyces sp. SID11385]